MLVADRPVIGFRFQYRQPLVEIKGGYGISISLQHLSLRRCQSSSSLASFLCRLIIRCWWKRCRVPVFLHRHKFLLREQGKAVSNVGFQTEEKAMTQGLFMALLRDSFVKIRTSETRYVLQQGRYHRVDHAFLTSYIQVSTPRQHSSQETVSPNSRDGRAEAMFRKVLDRICFLEAGLHEVDRTRQELEKPMYFPLSALLSSNSN